MSNENKLESRIESTKYGRQGKEKVDEKEWLACWC